MTKRSICFRRIRLAVGVDSHWSWLVCFASFLIQFIVVGIQNSFGSFFIEFLNDFREGESSTAWIGSVSFGLTFMNGPLATAMCARWGSRVITCLGATLICLGLIMTSLVTSFPWLYVTYGILFGLGSSFAYFASIAGLTSFFKKHLCFAYGVTLAGSGVGTPAMIIIMEYLIGIYGWRSTFRIIAAVSAVLFLCGLTYLPVDTNNTEKSNQRSKFFQGSTCEVSKESPLTDDVKKPVRPLYGMLKKLLDIFDPEPFKDCAFAIWVVALGFCIFGYFIPFVFVIRMAKDIGVPRAHSTLLIVYLAINQTVFKVLFGKLGDFARSKRIMILQGILFIQAIATMLCPLATKYGYFILVIYVVLFGFADGCWSVMIGMGTELIVGKAMMPRAFGCLYGLISIPLILGPPIAGLIFDKSRSYGPAFILSGSTLIIGILLMFVVQRMIGKRLTAEKTEKDVEVTRASSDDIKIMVDFNERIGASSTHLDKQQLVPWRRRVLEEPYSRPSSLVISRLLDDAQATDGALHCQLACHDQIAFVGYPVVKSSVPKQISQHFGTDKYTPNIISGDQECLILATHKANGSINSDSGRSTGSEETASLRSVRSRFGSTDTDLEYDTETGKDAFPEVVTSYKTSCSLYREKESDSIGDIFSKLMEKALEIEKIYVDTKPKCSRADTELSRITQAESSFSWDRVIGSRETVL
ncbi:monocarboxylate transporter 10-like [Actinia tenebrosa]|uniref:Monocarboxylate transporter 10-like n=1 Tax=Actinia tenebrosa TaxID=6105 RepID=A0A6P8HZZ5_ACTTE|nr:monocarboxylate transporter 10-like [Actinia tenebrosa]